MNSTDYRTIRTAVASNLNEPWSNVTHGEIAELLAERDRLREWQENAVFFIESSLRIAQRSCNPGDGLDVGWAYRLIREAGGSNANS